MVYIYIRRMKKKTNVAALFVFLFFACSSDPMFDPLDLSEQGVTIRSLGDGSLVGAGATVPVSVGLSENFKKRRSADSLSLLAVLKDAEDKVLAEVYFGPELVGGENLPPIGLPPIEPGSYLMSFSLRDADEVLAEKEVFFFYDPGKYSLTKISAYPPSFLPGSTGVFRAFISAPAGSDPYIRWTVNDKVLREDSLSDGGDRVFWTAPLIEGVYPVRAELYPFAPPTGRTHAFPAPLALSGQVYVDKTRRLAETDFSPEDDYYTLFHFLGNLKDDGNRPGRREYGREHLKTTGVPRPDFLQDVFGYYLDGASGFLTDDLLLPLGEDRSPVPHTIRMRIFPLSPVEGRFLLRAVSEDGSFGLSVFTDGDGILVFRIASGGQTLERKAGTSLPPGRTILLELYLEPGADSLASAWFLDGKPVSAAEDLFRFGPVPPAGTTRIGGDDGFIGLIDEFGIFPRRQTAAGPSPEEAGRDLNFLLD